MDESHNQYEPFNKEYEILMKSVGFFFHIPVSLISGYKDIRFGYC